MRPRDEICVGMGKPHAGATGRPINMPGRLIVPAGQADFATIRVQPPACAIGREIDVSIAPVCDLVMRFVLECASPMQAQPVGPLTCLGASECQQDRLILQQFACNRPLVPLGEKLMLAWRQYATSMRFVLECASAMHAQLVGPLT